MSGIEIGGPKVERLYVEMPAEGGGGIAQGGWNGIEPSGAIASCLGNFKNGVALFGVELDSAHQVGADVSHEPNVPFLALLANLGESLQAWGVLSHAPRSEFVSLVVACFVGRLDKSIADMLVGSMPFHLGDANGLAASHEGEFVQEAPQVTVLLQTIGLGGALVAGVDDLLRSL